MVKSMTGFGRSEYSDGKRNITVEIKSVNHRYCDISVKMPRRYSFAEEKIKSIVKETAKRGKIDVSVMVENITEDDTNIKLNTSLAKQYCERLTELKETFGVEGEITLEFLSGLPDVMKAAPDVEDEEEIIGSMSAAVKEAAKNHDTMRITEGKKLAEDIIKRGRIIAGYVDEINEISDKVTAMYKDKLRDRIKELIGNSVEIPEERIITEAAIFADKSNVTEELVRLDSHIKQIEDIIGRSSQPDGKKLDFIVQEMNREANTTGSKSADLGITNIVVEMKSEIEKIREQVQNIE
ncbi:MAG: YicC/YloC family endoribonuclease [Bacillota bacterium]|nr:YicC/YloC family endoribonuclease [Bacillota bacterium]